MNKLHHHTFLIVIPLFILFVLFLINIKNLTLNYFIGFLFSWILIGGYGLEIGFHRYFSHYSFKCNKFIEYILALLGSLALNGSPIFWKSVHISHHKHTDTLKDPHSPLKGIFTSYIGWTIYNDSINSIKIANAGRNLLTSDFHKFLHKYYYLIILSTFTSIYLIDSWFFLLSFIPAVFLSFNQGPLVNYFCHAGKYGYSNFELNNNSKNVKPLSFITFGLSLHNNHHRYPNNINFAVNKNEIDIGYYLSKLISHD